MKQLLCDYKISIKYFLVLCFMLAITLYWTNWFTIFTLGYNVCQLVEIIKYNYKIRQLRQDNEEIMTELMTML